MRNLNSLSVTCLAALGSAILPHSSYAHGCTPEITQVHHAECVDRGLLPSKIGGEAQVQLTEIDNSEVNGHCSLHIQGSCLNEIYGTPSTGVASSSYRIKTEYRIVIADGGAGEFYPAEVIEPGVDGLGVPDLQVSMNTMVSCPEENLVAYNAWTEDRLVKIQMKKYHRWVDVDSKFVTFACVPAPL